MPAEIEPLLRGDPDTLASAVTAGLTSGAFRWSHRAVLLNTIARMDAASLPRVIAALRDGRDALDAAGDDVAPLALWEALIELASMRVEMLAELQRRPTGRTA